MKALLDAILFDVGGTLVEEASAGTAVADLRVRLLPGVLDDLTTLAARLPLGAVTNTAVMGEAEVRTLLAPSGVSDLLSVVVTSAEVGAAKPDPKPLLEALRRLGLRDPSRVLYVGDQASDETAAAEAGLAFARVEPERVLATVERWLQSHAGQRFARTAARVRPLDAAAARAAATHHLQLAKPRDALGRLETVGIQLAAIAGTSPAPVPESAVVAVFAGDHGVVTEGVSPWPQEVTAQMVATFMHGGAAINVLACHVGAEVVVVDVGVAAPLGHLTPGPEPGPESGLGPRLIPRNVRRGTANLAVEAAMSPTEVRTALDVGVEVAERVVEDGARCLITGDMGIGNTTAAAALIAAITGQPPAAVVGRGSGADDAILARKVAVVERALARLANGPSEVRGPHETGPDDPLVLLAEVGGLEIAALAGFIVAGTAAGVPVLVDGAIAAAGLLMASRLVPGVEARCLAGHRGREPGSAVVLDYLGLDPLLDLDLCLGEGSGAVLALPVVQAAAKVLVEMATLDAAGVTGQANG